MPDHSEERLDLLTIALRRRDFLKGGLGMAALGFLGYSAPAASHLATPPLIGFKPLPMVTTPNLDTVRVAEGYSARPFFSWGDAVMQNAPDWLPDASQDWQAQAMQAGQGHDGMWYFPFPDQPDHHGLLVINHEHLQTEFLHPAGSEKHCDEKGRIRRPLPEVRKEQMAHGLSIIEIRLDASGQWQRILPSRFNRRITAQTPMHVSGPAAGSALLKTAADPDGRTVLGTLNNCAMGVTPWGTYLTCEENFHKYFVNRNKDDYQQRSSHSRYEILQGDNDDMYQWGSIDPRFDATPASDRPHQGFVNEPHRFGWVVEIDPFDPAAIPVKRTALGRFCHEGATVTLAADGRVVVYSGDDSKGEYIYRFVSREKFVVGSKLNHTLLDDGTLSVARFHDNGRGEWLPLVQGQGPLTAANGFATQADVLVNARLAADKLLATPMDRPEWISVHPHSGEVYVTLTNNDKRGTDFPLNAANPRRENLHGHIVRWQPASNNHAADTFRWEIFLLAGIRHEQQDLFSSPDGLWIDPNYRLWIATDFDDSEAAMKDMGYNQLLCADPVTRETRRFLIGPKGCEITGITMTPDCRTLWVNVQDPALSYPASDGKTRARSSTVVITKNDGGVIGT